MEIPRADRRPASRQLLIVAAAFAAAAALAILTIDPPIARAIGAYEISGAWNRILELVEWTVGYPIHPLFSAFAVVIATLAAMIVPRWRAAAPTLMFIAGTHIFARYATNQLKDLTGRLRPGEWLKQGGGDTFFRDGISFPSGHVALFGSLAIPIAMRWPRTRPILVLVAFVGAARVAVNAHFVSDTLGAITVVALVAWAMSHGVRPFARR